ncbi:alpha-1A adrenergic receptor-like [Lingula anatina]|uniref:Alpha-1A adrenergic receptor-like n=1 Tax=Lingula anatina TaxID=7574 RepID=A0A1S3K548_LINAN|nr:alpha-1A adrenergic receptor-like [Lingula anatina]|eukprot:XP_013417632.1 alpha-1A adrenergic receptor-like [Lingula anatina]
MTDLCDDLEVYNYTKWARITVTVLSTIAIVLGTFGNASVIIITISTPILRTWDNSFHINLAVVDLLICITVAPFTIFSVWSWGEHFPSKCTIARGIIFGPAINMTILATISVLRSYKIRHPTHDVSKALMKAGIVLPWMIGFCLSMVDILRKKEYPFQVECHSEGRGEVTVSALIPLAIICGTVMLVSYISAFKKILHQRQAIKPYATGHIVSTISNTRLEESQFNGSTFDATREGRSRHFAETLACEYSDVFEIKNGTDHHYIKLVQKDQHVIVTSLIVIAVYVLTVLPTIIMNRVFVLVQHSVHAYGMAQVTASFVIINSFANPFIYTLRTDVVRKRFCDWMTSIRKKIRPPENKIEDNYI